MRYIVARGELRTGISGVGEVHRDPAHARHGLHTTAKADDVPAAGLDEFINYAAADQAGCTGDECGSIHGVLLLCLLYLYIEYDIFTVICNREHACVPGCECTSSSTF